MAITHLKQYPDGNSVLVHHTVKKSVYSFVYLQDELKYTAYLADTNSTHLANSCWLDYSDCSIWFPFSGFYPQFGLIQRTMFYEQHKTIRFVVIQSKWKTGIIIKTSLPICINPFRMLAAAHGWVLYSTLSLLLVSSTATHIKIVMHSSEPNVMHASYFSTCECTKTVTACCDFIIFRPIATLVLHYVFSHVSHLYCFINFK
jgi:hypothetical protein